MNSLSLTDLRKLLSIYISDSFDIMELKSPFTHYRVDIGDKTLYAPVIIYGDAGTYPVCEVFRSNGEMPDILPFSTLRDVINSIEFIKKSDISIAKCKHKFDALTQVHMDMGYIDNAIGSPTSKKPPITINEWYPNLPTI